jgi:hypothetical protein
MALFDRIRSLFSGSDGKKDEEEERRARVEQALAEEKAEKATDLAQSESEKEKPTDLVQSEKAQSEKSADLSRDENEKQPFVMHISPEDAKYERAVLMERARKDREQTAEVEGQITVSDAPEKVKAKEVAEKDKTQEVTPEEGKDDLPRVTPRGNYIGANKTLGIQPLKQLVEAGPKSSMWQTDKGHTVLETEKSLIALSNPLMSEESRKLRAEAMIEKAAQKFPGKPLRIDGNKQFVESAIDAALARGVTIEVPEKYADLLLAKEQEQERAKKQALEQHVHVTGYLVGYSADPEDSRQRIVTIRRAGQDVAVKIDKNDVPEARMQALVDKPVVLERKPGSPAVLTDRSKEKSQTRGADLSRTLEPQR